MSPESFCYWLQGFVELHAAEGVNSLPTYKQWLSIVEHLGLVFNKVTSEPAVEPVKQVEDTLPEITQEGQHIDWSKYLPMVPDKKDTFWIDLPKETQEGFFPSWYEQYGIPPQAPGDKRFVLTC